MIDADIRGKLGRDGRSAHDRSEDLLTSTVFGLLQYLDIRDSFLPLISRVRPVSFSDCGPAVAGERTTGIGWIDVDQAARCDVRFWPSFGRWGQPDLLLCFRDAGHRPLHFVVIEAKL